MPEEPRKILVTSALPYANGDIHIGHLFEYIQTDIWVRYQRLAGNDIRFVCADDAHGTPVMLRAAEEGIPPEELIGRMHDKHVADFGAFGVSFDNYHTTHSEENRALAEEIYGRLREAGLIDVREVEQLFDPEEKVFLPDRYVRGRCPRCGAQDQYGDSCESCGAAYSTRELVEPRSAISGATPVWKTSDHHFLRLGEQGGMLREWINAEIPDPAGGGGSRPRLQKEARNKLDEWFRDGLKDWDISRDGPYFGFRIPGTEDKYFYVWLDAPIGYMASFRNLCDREGIDFDRHWRGDGGGTELYHFIGKDILYFHALFWPAMLHNSGFRMPTRLFAHGFLMVDGEKMSKSRGTFITARSWIDQGLNPEWLRYYFASKLNDRIEDVNLGLDDFVNRVNSDLVGKLANIPSRVAGFLGRRFGGELCAPDERWIEPDAARLAALYEDRRFSELVQEVMRLVEKVNVRVEQARPWDLAKDESALAELQRVCSCALESFRVLCVLLKPVLPGFVGEAEKFLGTGPLAWKDLGVPLEGGHKVGRYQRLMSRVDRKMVNSLLEANRVPEAGAPGAKAGPAPKKDGDGPPAPIGIGEFARVDMRVAEVLEAHEVEGSDKLLRLVLDLGDARKTVFAGIKGHWAVDELAGRQVVVVNNLAPRKMRFGTSEGMVLAAEDGEGVHLLAPARKCANGSRIS